MRLSQRLDAERAGANRPPPSLFSGSKSPRRALRAMLYLYVCVDGVLR